MITWQRGAALQRLALDQSSSSRFPARHIRPGSSQRHQCSSRIYPGFPMTSYIIKRLLQGVLVLFLVSLLTFFVMYFMPGDPARNMVGQGRVTEDQLEAIRDKWGLNDPWYDALLGLDFQRRAPVTSAPR